VLTHEHKVEEKLVAATVSITTMLSVATVLVAVHLLSGVVGGTR
jgi:predicted permease